MNQEEVDAAQVSNDMPNLDKLYVDLRRRPASSLPPLDGVELRAGEVAAHRSQRSEA